MSIFTILKQTTSLTIKRQRAMSTVDKSKIKAFFSDIEKMLTVNGDYILVDDNMELQSWCIYTVKNGKLYDNISFDMDQEPIIKMILMILKIIQRVCNSLYLLNNLNLIILINK